MTSRTVKKVLKVMQTYIIFPGEICLGHNLWKNEEQSTVNGQQSTDLAEE